MIILLWSSLSRAADLYVGGGGSPNYTTIQLAVNAANSAGGDVIHVATGTIISGSGTSTAVVTVNSNGITINGFTITKPPGK